MNYELLATQPVCRDVACRISTSLRLCVSTSLRRTKAPSCAFGLQGLIHIQVETWRAASLRFRASLRLARYTQIIDLVSRMQELRRSSMSISPCKPEAQLVNNSSLHDFWNSLLHNYPP